MANKYYKFKNVKHSLILKFVLVIKNTGKYLLENKDYKGLFYEADPEELEEVK